MTRVYLGVGTNIDRRQNSLLAVTELKKLDANLKVSTVYRCPASGFDGAEFFNFVVELDISLELEPLKLHLRALEVQYGRPQDARKNQDRTLDIDILLFGSETCLEKPQLPRSDIYKFNFVLHPLLELCPDLVIPNDGRTVRQLWEQTFESIGGMKNLFPVSIQF
ncbi:2-amino-4-hydroxy-6-hydroxymethyldihydropteridine diphosphokinase [Vibrio gallicus]|uniref:2-amino-4-hydroxy-6- hydroxymethyldihydropteridine diphosphokinase n=1 Tax=Vibrio gallicus TaxID=190897 RepID=UPI0021C3E326|nr:2-amino-4-hydroxy-6-hydroxymethyldihydropteridine diphosphokinase [Vibrio gallicus]